MPCAACLGRISCQPQGAVHGGDTGVIQTRTACSPLCYSDCLSQRYDLQLVHQEFTCENCHIISEVLFFFFLQGNSYVSTWASLFPSFGWQLCQQKSSAPSCPPDHHVPDFLMTCPDFLWST